MIDVAKRSVTLRGQTYRNWQKEGGPRVPFTIQFTRVDAITTAADLAALADNASAGHLNHARLADGPGTSHLYLMEGHLSVTSQRAPKITLNRRRPTPH